MADTGLPWSIKYRGDGENSHPINEITEEMAESMHEALDSMAGGAKWARAGGSSVFTPTAAGVTLSEANAVYLPGWMATVYIRLANVTWPSGAATTNLGTVAPFLRPVLYFMPWLGWPGQTSGLVEAASGILSVRYAETAGSGSSLLLTGTWPLAPL